MAESNPKVDRYLDDKAMDHIDHALGRPLDPLGDTFRNYFAIGSNTKLAAEFRSSPYWRIMGARDDMVYFSVTKAGRQALVAHLKSIKDPWKPFDVSFGGITTRVSAKSAGNAKYQKYLRISDCLGDMRFGEFARKATVRAVPTSGGRANG